MDTINQTQLASVSIEYWVNQAKALENLKENKDFQTVILNGYFKDKAIAGTSILASDQVKESGRRPDVMEGLVAISALQDHFKTIQAMGQQAIDEVEESELED